MAGVRNRVTGKASSKRNKLLTGSVKSQSKLKAVVTLDTKVSVSDGFKGLRELNQRALTSLKH